jgi:hypothetical protein
MAVGTPSMKIRLNLIISDHASVGGGSSQAFALHAPAPVDQFGHSDKDLLGVAASKLACPPEGVGVDDGDAPARGTTGEGDTLGGRTAAHDDEIDLHGHALIPTSPNLHWNAAQAGLPKRKIPFPNP